MKALEIESGARPWLMPGYMEKFKTGLIKGRSLCDHEHAGPSYCHPEVPKYGACPYPEDCWYGKLTASAENIILMLNGTNWLFCSTPPCNDESFLFMGSVYLRPDGWPEKVVWTRISQETLHDLQEGIREQTGITPWFMQGFENEEQIPRTKPEDKS